MSGSASIAHTYPPAHRGESRDPGRKRLPGRTVSESVTPQASARVAAEGAEETQRSQRVRLLCVLRAFSATSAVMLTTRADAPCPESRPGPGLRRDERVW